MPIINNERIKKENNRVDLGNLELEIECDNHSDINKNIFINNYSKKNEEKLLNMIFTYNEKNKEISEYKFEIKNSDKEKKYFRANALIVAAY